MKSPLINKSRKVAWFKPFLYPHGTIGTYYGAHKISCSDSAAMNVIIGLDKAPRLSIRIVIWILPSDTETSATTLWERLQNLWRASAQGKVLESGVFWWISYPTHMKSMLSGFLGSQVHHRRAERGVSITLPSLRQSNFGKLQFGFVLADFQISPTLKLYFWALFRPALHKMSQIKWCHVKINNPEKNISLLLW